MRALLALALFALASGCTRRVVEEDVGLRGIAARRPLLAAEHFAAEMGLAVRGVSGLASLPPAEGALVLSSRSLAHREERARALLDWVAAGGHLVLGLEPRTPGSSSPGAQAGLGVRDPLPGSDLLALLGAGWAPHVLRERAVRSLRLSPEHERCSIRSRAPYRLIDVEGRALPGVRDGGGFLLRLSHGDGLVDLLADVGPFTNEAIGERDHARLLWELLMSPAPPSEVWIVHAEPASFLALLAARGWQVLLALGVWLALWLWRSAARFGPIVDVPPPVRRDFSEHVRAAGAYHWTQGHLARLAGAPRARLFARLETARPEWHGRRAAELAADLAALTGLEPERCAAALAPEPARDPRSFTRLVRDLQTMRKAL